jgi:phosphate starvation-inducible PhoH-like protein
VLRDVRGIAITYFTAADVVRHPLVARIVEAYEAAEAAAEEPPRPTMRPPADRSRGR